MYLLQETTALALTYIVICLLNLPDCPLAVQVGDNFGGQLDVVAHHLLVAGQAWHSADPREKNGFLKFQTYQRVSKEMLSFPSSYTSLRLKNKS